MADDRSTAPGAVDAPDAPPSAGQFWSRAVFAAAFLVLGLLRWLDNPAEDGTDAFLLAVVWMLLGVAHAWAAFGIYRQRRGRPSD